MQVQHKVPQIVWRPLPSLLTKICLYDYFNKTILRCMEPWKNIDSTGDRTRRLLTTVCGVASALHRHRTRWQTATTLLHITRTSRLSQWSSACAPPATASVAGQLPPARCWCGFSAKLWLRQWKQAVSRLRQLLRRSASGEVVAVRVEYSHHRLSAET